MNTKLFGVVSALLMLGASTINSAVADTFALSGVVDIYNNTYSGSFDYSGGGVFSNANIVFNSPNYYAPVPNDTLFATIIVPDSNANQLFTTNTTNGFTYDLELFFSVPLDTLLGIPGGIDALLSSSIQAGALDPNHDLLPNDFITGAVVNQTPLPAALPLFATGLGALGLLGWRRKKKAAA